MPKISDEVHTVWSFMKSNNRARGLRSAAAPYDIKWQQGGTSIMASPAGKHIKKGTTDHGRIRKVRLLARLHLLNQVKCNTYKRSGKASTFPVRRRVKHNLETADKERSRGLLRHRPEGGGVSNVDVACLSVMSGCFSRQYMTPKATALPLAPA